MRTFILWLLIVPFLTNAGTDLYIPFSDELKEQLGLHIVDFGVDANGIKTINIGYCNRYIDLENNVLREAKGADVQLIKNNQLIIRTRASILKESDLISYTVVSYQVNNKLVIELGYGSKGASIADRVILLELENIPLLSANSKNLAAEIRAITSC